MKRSELARALRVACGLLARGEDRIALAQLRTLADSLARPPLPAPEGQLALVLRAPRGLVDGCPLHVGVTVATCIARQLASERAGSKANGANGGPPPPKNGRRVMSSPEKRGVGPKYILCAPNKCPIGNALRASYGDAAACGIREGARMGIDRIRQAAARREQERARPFPIAME